MKKDVPVKYPHSANLFQFCRKVLDHKFGGVRVIDQDVGQILGFDPADCSHWKKGKKNIRSIQAMKAIAEHLGVDERLIVEVASGEMSDGEAFHEYRGYGTFVIEKELLEAARKDFYRKHAHTWTREKDEEFKRHFDLREAEIDRIVGDIHKRIAFEEAPLYLPEVAAAFPKVQLHPLDANTTADVATTRREDGSVMITFPNEGKLRPFVRFQIAKAMAVPFFEEAGLGPLPDFGDYGEHVTDIRTNLFAAKLLMPAALIRKELASINVAKDIVSQLAESFWVSKAFMNGRLKDILQDSST